MTAIGVALMGAGVWVILGSPDLSGATMLGALLFLIGLTIVHRVQDAKQWRRAPRDSTDRAVEAQAEGMVDRG